MKQHHLILISFLIVLILVLGFVSAYVAEGSLLTYHGFSVDSNHRIYFGKENGELSVYKNGKCINKVSIPARGYSFTIQNGNELVFLNGEDLSYYSIHDSNNDLLSLVKKMDVKDSDYKYSAVFYDQYAKKKYFEGIDGHLYELKFSMIYTYICDGSDVVLKMQNNLAISISCLFIGIIAFVIVVIISGRRQGVTRENQFLNQE